MSKESRLGMYGGLQYQDSRLGMYGGLQYQDGGAGGNICVGGLVGIFG